MERSEPTLVPEWLKGGSGLGGPPHLSQPNFYQDDAGGSFSSRHRSLQQISAAGSSHGDYDSPRFSSSSDRAIFPSSRRGSSGSSGVVERPSADKDSLSQARGYPSLGRSSSHRNHDAPERDRDGLRGDRDRDCEGLRGDRDRDWDREIERSRDRDRVQGLGSIDERERERERTENGSTWRAMSGPSGRLEADPSLWRSQSMGLSTRSYDNGLRKTNESISLPAAAPSASSGLAVNMQKAAFERNFPSLGADEKQGSVQQITGNAAVVSPRPLWQGSPRPDFGRSSSPGGPGRNRPLSPGGPTASAVNVGGNGTGDVWSSALAESPFGNHNVLINGVVPSVSTVASASSFNPGVASAISSNALNMAEALVQNPPRARTPPQLLIETQRLEELALKQSRQLIPMTPSLPKTMSAADKAKPKVLRTVDTLVPSALKGGQPAASQLNSPHRSVVTARPETPKSSQGKLLVLKSSKDGGSSLTSSMKIEGSNPAQGAPLSGTGISVSATSLSGTNGSNVGVIGVRKQKQFLDRRASSISAVSGNSGVDVGTGVRARDSSVALEDKRPSLQAQNRSDFFNTLRKKAAGNGTLSLNPEKLDSSPEQKMDGIIPKSEMSGDTTGGNGQNSCADGNGTGNAFSKPSDKPKSALSNGDRQGKHSPTNGIILEEPATISMRSSAVEVLEETQTAASVIGTSEEEEAAFLRSLGWEENAEGEALTEEEINAFYQMREKKLNNGKRYQWMNAGVEQHVGSLESVLSALSSSDSESDD